MRKKRRKKGPGTSGEKVKKMAGLKFQAQRAAFSVAADAVLKYVNKNDDRTKALLKVVDLTESFAKDRFKPESYEAARKMIQDPENKWMQYLNRLFDEVSPNVLKTTALNLGFDAMLYGTKVMHEAREKYQCNVPWLILMDPTSACNLKCTGCWAAEYGHLLNLSFEDMDRVITQGKELGIYLYMLTGGEPLVRKKDIIRLCEKHNDCEFHAFTNGTLVDEEFCNEMERVGNLTLSISLEGYEKVNDGRRGKGVYEKVMHAMDLLKEHGLVFGTSICYTSANYKSVTSEDFIQMLVEKGCRYALYFHYMPVGNAASVDLLLNPEQRIYVKNRVREIRNMEHGPGIFTMDFQNDGEFVGGCIAGGRNYFHINANGDAEPCVFIHYSNGNIHENTILEILKQPLFMAYHDNQPFNDNMLRPCPMLENPEILQRIVKESGAHSTDLQSNETAEHLCGKCLHYAEEWAPVAEKLWAEEKAEKAAKEAAK